MQREKKIPRTRTIGFRLTETEYAALVAAAEQDQRRTAELVRLMVLDALKRRAMQAIQTGQKVEAGQ
jgi:ribosomal protein L2